MTKQLEFLPKNLETKMEEVYERLEKMRKSLYARNGAVVKELSETKHELAILKDAMKRCSNQPPANLF